MNASDICSTAGSTPDDDTNSGSDENSEDLSDWGLDLEPLAVETDLSDGTMGWSDDDAELLASPPDTSSDEQERTGQGAAAALATSGPRNALVPSTGVMIDAQSKS